MSGKNQLTGLDIYEEIKRWYEVVWPRIMIGESDLCGPERVAPQPKPEPVKPPSLGEQHE